MKTIFFLFFSCFLGLIQHSSAQVSWTGTFRLGDANLKDSDTGTLEIKQLSETKIKFTLKFSLAHNEHGGDIDGEATLDASGSAIFFSDEHDADAPCSLIFQFRKSEILITQDGSDTSCGFGSGVDVSGTYKKINSNAPSIK